jgi:hypothetical protein
MKISIRSLTSVVVLALFSLISSNALAADHSFVGKWKMNRNKSQDFIDFNIEIKKWQNDGYTLFPDVDTHDLHYNFKLDGKDYIQPPDAAIEQGTTVAANRIDDHTIELTFKLNGKTTETHRWKLSADGETLTTTLKYPDSTESLVDVFDRE